MSGTGKDEEVIMTNNQQVRKRQKERKREREKERKKERKKERERGREREREIIKGKQFRTELRIGV